MGALWELLGSSLRALWELVAVADISPVNDSPLVLKNMPVLFTSMKNYSASKSLFDDAIYEVAEDDAEELFH